MKHALSITFLICLIAVFGTAKAQGEQPTAPAAPNYVPDTSLTYKDFLEQCVTFKKRENVQELWVVQFWASWSSKSLSDMTRLKQLQTKYKNKPVRFVSISVDKSSAAWTNALTKVKVTWEQLRITNEADYDFLKRAFKHNELPALFLIDKKGGVKRMKMTSDLSAELADEAKKLPDGAYVKPIIAPPPPPPPAPEPPKPKEPDYTGWIIHKVEQGETLYSIARRYNISVTEIQTNNELTGNTIKIGQILKVRQEL